MKVQILTTTCEASDFGFVSGDSAMFRLIAQNDPNTRSWMAAHANRRPDIITVEIVDDAPISEAFADTVRAVA